MPYGLLGQFIRFAGSGTSRDLTISSNAIPVYLPTGTLSKAVAQGSGTVKSSAGTLLMILPTTSGDIDIKDGNTTNARIAVVAGTTINFTPWGIPFTTSISLSVSSAVATIVYV